MKCPGSTVEPSKEIIVNAQKHAGLVTHKCVLDKGHEGSCKCKCSFKWVKNFK